MAWKRKTSLFVGAVMLVMAGGMGGGLLVLGLGADVPVASAYYAVDSTATAEAPPTQQVSGLTAPFRYQGRLLLKGTPVNDACDFNFLLYGAETRGTPLGSFTGTSVNKVKIVDGLFSVTVPVLNSVLVFTGPAVWLETRVRCSGATLHTKLSPRQVLEAVPYAAYAYKAGSAQAADSAESATSAADADNLGGRPAVDYALKTDIPTAGAGGAASNADTLDGFDSTAFAKAIDVANKVDKGGDEIEGDLTLKNFAGLNFPGFTRQAIDFIGTAYGIGVQPGVLYNRSDSGFAWFSGGAHSNTANNPGGNGEVLMKLDSAGRLHPNSIRIEPEERAQALVVKGRRAGNFDESVAYFENTPSGTASNRFAGPAMRVVTKEGQSQDGVLSVSNEGFGGYIARFGNSNKYVTSIDQQGNVSTDGDIIAGGRVSVGGDLEVGGKLDSLVKSLCRSN